jgi:hypothetical protein
MWAGSKISHSKRRKLMNTPTHSTHTKGTRPAKAFQASPQRLVTFLLVGLTLVLFLAVDLIATLTNSNRTTGTEEKPVAVSYSNALEMQYAQPWLDTQNKGTIPFSNAIEVQYAQPWLDAQNKAAIPFSNALEMQYAQPWLDAQDKAAIPYGNALEMQYAKPWLDAQKLLDCHSRLDLFYACQNR